MLSCQAVEQMQQSRKARRVCCTDRCMTPVQVILVGGKQGASTKARHGMTPPMRDAARRMFDHTPVVDQKVMQKLEDDLLTITQVRCLGPCDMKISNAAFSSAAVASAC